MNILILPNIIYHKPISRGIIKVEPLHLYLKRERDTERQSPKTHMPNETVMYRVAQAQVINSNHRGPLFFFFFGLIASRVWSVTQSWIII